MADRPLIGARVRRIEDPRLLSGRGRYVDDISPPGLLHAAFVRSPHAHARLGGIDCTAAKALPGVHAVYSLADFLPHLTTDRIPLAMPSPAIRHVLDPTVLAKGEVFHVGEAVAMVVADSRAIAEDAAELVEVDYESFEPVVDPRLGLQPDAPRARLDCSDNLAAFVKFGYGDIDAAFSGAPVVVRQQFSLHKGGGHSIEGRGLVAQWDPSSEELTVWDSTQMPHRAKTFLVTMLGLSERQIRVIAPDVGGGFGPKFVFYAEEVAVSLTARLLGRPVKWVEDRYEHFVATTQERDQFWDVEVAVETDGRLRGIRGQLIHDHGAYTPYGIALPYNSATNSIGPYLLPAYKLDISLVITNKVPATPTRGAGRPQGTLVMERLLDQVADRIGIDRAEIRRRNFIRPEQMPYDTRVVTRDGGAMVYDSGDYPRCQEIALRMADWVNFPARQRAARAAGRYIGLGLANYVEGTGRGPFEMATVRVGPSGKVVVETGATAQGQGIATALAQVCADHLGVSIENIDVVAGDTARTPLGLGAFASRQAAVAGSAVFEASQEVRTKILEAASHMLEAAADDLVLRNGWVEVTGVPGSGVTLAEVACTLQGMPGYSLPPGVKPGLEATSTFSPQGMTYCNGAHLCEVEVDPGTGLIRIHRYIVVHDCGRLINPTIVEGQIVGGVVHGIGHALFEHMRHDENGQPMTVHYGDYHLPTAPDMPRIEIAHIESPTPLNPLGVKGAGESGTIAAAAAILSGIDDALRPFGVRLSETPVTPMRLIELLEEAEAHP